MNFPLYIAKRYLRSKSSNNAINFITIIAVVGVILGSASLFIVLSGFSGLKDFTLKFSSIIDPDLKAETAKGKSFLLTDADISKLNQLSDIAQYSKIVEERVIVASQEKNTIATLKGVDERFEKVVNFDTVIEHGHWIDPNSRQIIVGWGIANTLSLGVLDFTNPINIYVPKPGKGQITSTKNAFNSVKVVNKGVFFINEKLNDTYVFGPIELAQNLLNYEPNQINAIEFKLKEGVDEALAKEHIQAILGDKVVLKNRAQLNDALYKMLNTENLVVYLIFTLVLIIAFFNVIGSLIMMMLDKKRSLNTLFNIGVTIKDIRRIFFYQGSLMSIVGGFIGLLISLIIVFLQKTFSLVMITPSLAYPVNIKIENLFIVFVTISVLGIIASKIASVRVTKSLVEGR
ncbi:lipoprotein-releasing system permease protein [Mariniflexile fucanivorans]|uniref:Lipoprotein-releasing system permease protein n=1 Tax=Mariniflexile fucanivorans TaxID=264023 RepID=A0A4R1RSD4_9FLAO|nr:ABC transporter permease [Mariniflexile fucanivorans]TCL69284.1 lipoprotein-releasing system permease protein [Mariniflexile fucanivorans]